MPSRFRLDVARFQRERHAAIILVTLLFAAGFASWLFTSTVLDTARSYMLPRGFELTSEAAFRDIINKYNVVAVMFEAPGCRLCEQMYPYWSILERSKPLGVHYYHIVYSPATDPVFQRYHVVDTPTFILFVGGEPIARHVGPFSGPNVTKSMLEWIKAALREHRGKSLSYKAIVESEQEALDVTVLASSVAVAIAAGVAAAFSPCVLPLLIAYTAALSTTRSLSPGLCGLSASVGALGLAVLFLIIGALIAVLQQALLFGAGLAILAAGFASLLNVPFGVQHRPLKRAGTMFACMLYGLLAVQCTLPLVAGAMLAAAVGGVAGLAAAISFAATLGATLAAITSIAGRARSVAERLTARAETISRLAGLVMVAAGVYLSAHALGLA